MSAPLLFNPARASFEELEQTFVGRRPLLEQLERDLLADAGKKTARHWQIVAPRGSGKSHLTELLGRRLRENHGWAVVFLPEEHLQVSSLAELLEQVVRRLERLQSTPFDTTNVQSVEDLAIDRLKRWRRENKKALLVILENLGILFERKLTSRREQLRLREVLSRDPPFILVTTATSYVDATVRPDAPLYDFFQTMALEDFTQDEVAELVESRARWDREELLLSQADLVRSRLDAIYHFSGGNPRLVLDLYAILRKGVTEELHTQLLRLLDEVTPYYQARLKDISPQMERILTEMALADHRLTPSEVARHCRLATNQVTANIAKLEQERLVRPVGRPDKRRRYYEVRDRLLRLWIQMREDRSASARLRPLVEFFQHWYREDRQEINDSASRVAEGFWRDLDSERTRDCLDKLETISYLESATKVDDHESLALSVIERTMAPDSTEKDERRIERLTKLLTSSKTPDQQAKVAYLLAREHAGSGKHAEALSILAKAVDMTDGGVNAFIWSAYLRALRAEKGSKAAFEAGVEALAKNPRLWALNSLLSGLAAFLGRTTDAECMAREFAVKSRCPHCTGNMLRQLAADLVFFGRDKAARKVIALADSHKTIPTLELTALRQILSSSKLGRPKPDDLVRAQRLWEEHSKVPVWLLWRTSCALSHSPDRAAEAFPFIVELHRRRRCLDDHSLVHLFLALSDSLAKDDARSSSAIIQWTMANIDSPSLKRVLIEDMPIIFKGISKRGRFLLRAYDALREVGAIAEDVLPYSAAVAVEAAPDRDKKMASLHPEVQDAVRLLLPDDSVTEVRPSASDSHRPVSHKN